MNLDITAALKGYYVKLDPDAVDGANINVPFVFDWNSIAQYGTGSPLNAILRAVKGAVKSICEQVISGIEKVLQKPLINAH